MLWGGVRWRGCGRRGEASGWRAVWLDACALLLLPPFAALLRRHIAKSQTQIKHKKEESKKKKKQQRKKRTVQEIWKSTAGKIWKSPKFMTSAAAKIKVTEIIKKNAVLLLLLSRTLPTSSPEFVFIRFCDIFVVCRLRLIAATRFYGHAHEKS